MIPRKEKEKLVISLYKQGKTSREIAQEVGISFRDIGTITKKFEEKEDLKNQVEQYNSIASKAYQLFLEGNTPLQIAIKLHIRQQTISQLYQEFLHLHGMTKLSLIYDKLSENDCGIDYFVQITELALSQGFVKGEVMNLLRIANGDLSSVKTELGNYSEKLENLKFKIECCNVELEQIKNKIRKERVKLEQYLQLSNNITKEIEKKQNEKFELKEFIDILKINDEYIKIKNQIPKELEKILKDKQELLIIAIYSVIEYIKHPNKGNNLLATTVSFSKNRQFDGKDTSIISHKTPEVEDFSYNLPGGYNKKQLVKEIEEIFDRIIFDIGEYVLKKLVNPAYEME